MEYKNKVYWGYGWGIWVLGIHILHSENVEKWVKIVLK